MKLFHKLLLFNLLGKGVLLLLFLMSGPLLLRLWVMNSTDRELDKKQNQVKGLILENGIESFFSEEKPEEGFGSYNILKEEYVLLERTPEDLRITSPFSTEKRIIEEEEISYRVLAEILIVDEQAYLLEIGKSLKTIEEIEAIFYRISLGILILFLLFSAGLDSVISRVIMKPLDRIIQSKISLINEPQQFNDEPIPSTTQEFALLDEAISEMMKRIQKSFNQERIFISHASHELKTPISILQSKLEMIITDESLKEEQLGKFLEMQNTLQTMKKSVNALLMLSKVNNAQFLKKETVQILRLLEELVEDWGGIAINQGLELRVSKLEEFEVHKTNSSLLLMMIQNSLSNAVRYAYPNSVLEVKGENIPEGYRITVLNSGENIDSQILEQVQNGLVFLKDARRENSGFGLQLMFKIALFLGVKVTLQSENSVNRVEFVFFEKN
jgi:signal transduction histidine kinase